MVERKAKTPVNNSCPETQFVIAGVGGQWVLFATRVLARLALDRRLQVLHSPLVRKSQADALYVLQANELYGTATFLRPGGKCFINTAGSFRPNDTLKRYLKSNSISCRFIDADTTAQGLGSLVLANLVLIGSSLAEEGMPFILPGLLKAIKALSKPAFQEMNLAAARTGFDLEPLKL